MRARSAGRLLACGALLLLAGTATAGPVRPTYRTAPDRVGLPSVAFDPRYQNAADLILEQSMSIGTTNGVVAKAYRIPLSQTLAALCLALARDGLNKATVEAGTEGRAYEGRARLSWKAKGPSVPPLGLPLQGPVVLQIQASNGTCWGATFSTESVNDGTTWKGKSD